MAAYYCGVQLREARLKHGLTQNQLAFRMGLTQKAATSVSRWENNRMRMSRGSMIRAARAIGENPHIIFPEHFRSMAQTMTLEHYQLGAKRTMNPALSFEETSRHALHGMCAEVGEIHSLFQKFYQGHDVDAEHVKKEVGDLLWMIAEFCTVHGWSMGEVAQMNLDKLMARYPDGFKAEQSLHRKEGDV